MAARWLHPPSREARLAARRRSYGTGDMSLGRDFFAFTLAGVTSAASWERRATACQIRATAALRLVNFLTAFKSSNGATPAKLFQVSTRRDAGHSALSLASSFLVGEGLRLVDAGGKPGVRRDVVVRVDCVRCHVISPMPPVFPAALTFMALVQRNIKVNLPRLCRQCLIVGGVNLGWGNKSAD